MAIMFRSTNTVQLFRYEVTYNTYQLHIDDQTPPQYLWNGIFWTAEELRASGYLPIEESTYLGLPNLQTLGAIYFEDYVQGKHGDTVKDFLAKHQTSMTPVKDAICQVVWDLQNRSQIIPDRFTEALITHCEVSLEILRS